MEFNRFKKQSSEIDKLPEKIGRGSEADLLPAKIGRGSEAELLPDKIGKPSEVKRLPDEVVPQESLEEKLGRRLDGLDEQRPFRMNQGSKMRVKVFTKMDTVTLESEINRFIESIERSGRSFSIKDVKLSVNENHYVAMVIYKVIGK
jgi:hypothetical protein